MTAYFGMFDVGRLKGGETVCITGAAGSVGLVSAAERREGKETETSCSQLVTEAAPTVLFPPVYRRTTLPSLADSAFQIATQIALAHKNCKVIAIVGSQEKVDLLAKMGVHYPLNYKVPGFAGRLRAAGGIDVVFENVGGEILDLLLAQIRPHGRIALCGAISQYVSRTRCGRWGWQLGVAVGFVPVAATVPLYPPSARCRSKPPSPLITRAERR